jgi:poly(3-hydroxybutyrate) depolymerase
MGWWHGAMANNAKLFYMRIKPKSSPGNLLVLLASLIFAAANLSAQTSALSNYVARVYTNAAKAKMPYRLFIPSNYGTAAAFPLILYLHSFLENGTDNRLQITGEPGPQVFIAPSNQLKQPCFLVAPQNPNGYWTDTAARLGQIMDILGSVTNEFTIDPNRIYLMGMSMGGSATWQLLLQYSNLFAAGIPMSGGYYPKAEGIAHVPLWVFHAADDSAVAVSNSRNMIADLRKAGARPLYTEYKSGGHQGIWTTAYNTAGLVDWLMAQRRGAIDTQAPQVVIQKPTDQSSCRATPPTVSVAGIADANTNVTWTNFLLNKSGAIIGTTNWGEVQIPLRESATNWIAIIAKAPSGSSSLGGFTSFSRSLKVVANAAVRLTLSRTESSLDLTWSGGEPPYVIETSCDLNAGLWNALDPIESSKISLPVESARAQFFRIRAH